ncbi:MAG: hypothetical protein PHZ19_02715 [Candidatus Thermoplasmatota archaeon]|nr:hypothetical protein [Candidatus Thermoplasmatota archaeon]
MKKGMSPIWWLVLTVVVVLIVSTAWLATAKPIDYPIKKGREQQVVFNAYVTAEEVRNYAEGAAKLATFATLREMKVEPSNNCFDFTDEEKNEFIKIFNQAMELYMQLHPLENQWSDIFPCEYESFDEFVGDINEGVKSKFINNGNKIRIIGYPRGKIQVFNSRYIFMYSLDGSIDVEVSCKDYENYEDFRD